MIFPEDKVKLIKKIIHDYYDDPVPLDTETVLFAIETIAYYDEKEDNA